MLCSGAVYDAVESGSGFFQHGHTYIGHPTACAAGLAVVKKLTGQGERQGLIPRVTEMGDKLDAALRDAFGQHPHIGDIRGRGLFRALEIVEDRGSKAPFDPARGIAKKVKKAAMEAGLACYPMSGTIDGARGDHVLLAPPFIIEDAQIDELVGKLGDAFDAVL